MAGASSPSPNASTPPNHSSSWKGTDRSRRTTTFGRNRRTSGLPHRIGGDHGDAPFIEDALIQLHHLHRSPVPASDLRRQVLPEDKHLFAIGRANMRGKFSLGTVFASVRDKQDQVGKPACRQPREPAAVVKPPECKTPVTLEAVPSQLGDLESFAAHGLHGIPEDRLYMSDFYRHARPKTAQPTLG